MMLYSLTNCSLQSQLPMELAYPPNQVEVMGWINSTLTNCLKPVKDLQEMANGVAYLHVLRYIFPSAIDHSQIIHHPKDYEQIVANYHRIFQIFSREDLPFTLNIKQLAQPSLYEHFRICIFLFEKFGRPKQLTSFTKTSQSQRIKIIPPSKIKALLLQKGLNAQISLSELQSLHTKPKLKQILAQINKNESPNIKVQALQPNLQAFNCKQEYQRSTRQRISVLLNVNHQKNSKNFIDIHPKTAKDINSSIMKAFHIPIRQRFWNFIIQETTNYLQSKFIPVLADQEKMLIRQVKDTARTIKTLNLLFFDEDKDNEAKSNFRKYCRNYYRSAFFMRIIVANHYLKMNFKLTVVAYFQKYQLLTLKEFTNQEFQPFTKQYIDLSILVDKRLLSYTQVAQAQPIKKEIIQSSLQKTFSTEHYQQVNRAISNETSTYQSSNASKSYEVESLQIDCAFDPQDQDICEDQYWSLHNITMIAFQLQYIKKKDPQYDPDDLTHKSITPHTKFTTGFLFTCLKNHKDQKQKTFSNINTFPASKYPHLARILNNKDLKQHGQMRLAEFVRILLFLKHSTVITIFLEAYEVIIAVIKDLTFSDLKIEWQRFAIIDSITQKLRKSAQDIDQILKEMLQLQQNRNDAITLLRVTAYCFLAERFNFHQNEFWPFAFPSEEPLKKQVKTEVKREWKTQISDDS